MALKQEGAWPKENSQGGKDGQRGTATRHTGKRRSNGDHVGAQQVRKKVVGQQGHSLDAG